MHGKTFDIEPYAQSAYPGSFIPALLKGITDLYHFMPPNFTLLEETQGQWQAKPVGLVFLHTSQLIRMKFDVLKKFRFEHPGTTVE